MSATCFTAKMKTLAFVLALSGAWSFIPCGSIAGGPAASPDDAAALERECLLKALAPIGGADPFPEGKALPVLNEMLKLVPSQVLHQLVKSRIRLVIINNFDPGESRLLTELPEFSRLKGASTFDGRTWDYVRGAGNILQPDGAVAFGVGEESLRGACWWRDNSCYPRHNIFIHEFAHAIHMYGLSEEDQDLIHLLYEENKKKSKGLFKHSRFVDNYAEKNELEYFAQSVVTWLRAHYSINGDDWFKENDPAMYKLLLRIFGPSRSV